MDLYSSVLMDHYKKPLNVGELPGATNEAAEVNTSCGDRTIIQAVVENRRLKVIKHQTSGCVVAVGAASILSEKLRGRTVEEIEVLEEDGLGGLLGVSLTGSRIKCALLVLLALKKALAKK